jgi:hypothetical protein
LWFIREEEVSTMIRSMVNSDDSRPLRIDQTLSSLAMTIICRMYIGGKVDVHSHLELNDWCDKVGIIIV